MKQGTSANPTGPADSETVRLKRLREDGRRSLGVNLSEGIALSHMLMRFTGAAIKG